MNEFREAFPILYVDDVEEAVELYRTTFGFEETFRHDEEGRRCSDPNGHLIHVGSKAL